MPQMAPLLWLNLYAFFTAIFALIIILNFYTKLPIKIKTSTVKAVQTPQPWKW
ncbi:ATP synthase F0 subunit 8 (mitochondrion) [Palaemon carinicauda]|uniref:ATP synthase complex subunit 8 n=1 Tax=Palaemon carinicauda TaxID=392227 RepID=C1I1Y5_PALCI|nr:ATP synthase F0 subunit 8 [Palaemon carinicauda]ABQ63414.1 ATP synthase F0 subunit 8 [Palaemon carinicauda]